MNKKRQRSVYLIEWRTKKTHWSEMGLGVWEADHLAGIWFTKKGAKSAMVKRLAELPKGLYEIRVQKYVAREV